MNKKPKNNHANNQTKESSELLKHYKNTMASSTEKSGHSQQSQSAHKAGKKDQCNTQSTMPNKNCNDTMRSNTQCKTKTSGSSYGTADCKKTSSEKDYCKPVTECNDQYSPRGSKKERK